MSDRIETAAEEMIGAVETEMRQVLRAGSRDGDPFYGMMHYHMGWVDEDLRPIASKSGKRIRPLLTLLSCQASGGGWRRAVPAAAAVEILHNFTLIHDDIQDASPTRRGRTTLWRIWGASQAINSGDAMFALAHLAMVRLQDHGVADSVVVRALRRLDETCVNLTAGQYADMNFEQRTDVTVDEYVAMIEGKTAALIAFACELGALIGGADEASIEHYAAFGRDLGLAFQVRDDILGIWGDERVIGKSAATDIETRKKSLPVLYGLEQDQDLRQRYFQTDSDGDFVAQVIEALDQAGARPFAERYESEYADSAVAHLRAAQPQPPATDVLKQLVKQLLNRQA
jgi:geranylgeranyl diphosphate synthase, type I